METILGSCSQINSGVTAFLSSVQLWIIAKPLLALTPDEVRSGNIFPPRPTFLVFMMSYISSALEASKNSDVAVFNTRLPTHPQVLDISQLLQTYNDTGRTRAPVRVLGGTWKV